MTTEKKNKWSVIVNVILTALTAIATVLGTHVLLPVNKVGSPQRKGSLFHTYASLFEFSLTLRQAIHNLYNNVQKDPFVSHIRSVAPF